MFDVEEALVRFCREHGVPAWVSDELGRRLRLEDWAAWFVEQHVQPHIDEQAGGAAEAAAALHRVVSTLDSNPKQKSISTARLRAVIADN